MSRPAAPVDGPEIPTPEEIEAMNGEEREAAVRLVQAEAEKLLHGYVKVMTETGGVETVPLVRNGAENMLHGVVEAVNGNAGKVTVLRFRNEAEELLYEFLCDRVEKHVTAMSSDPKKQGLAQKRRVFALHLAAKALQIQLADVDDLLRRVCEVESSPTPKTWRRHKDAWLRAVEVEASAEPDPGDRRLSMLTNSQLASRLPKITRPDGRSVSTQEDHFPHTVGRWRRSPEYIEAVAKRRRARLSAQMEPELTGLSLSDKHRKISAAFDELYRPSRQERVQHLERELRKVVRTAR